MAFNIADLERSWELKNKSEQVSIGSNEKPITIHSYSYTRMYKISQFNLNINVGGVQSYFVSKYRPNIFNVPITIKASGIISDSEMTEYNNFATTGDSAAMHTMQYSEFYLPCRDIMTDFIYNLLAPSKILLTSVQSGYDGGRDIMRIVNDTNKGITSIYPSASLDYTYNYKVYYPIFSKQSSNTSSSYSGNLDSRVIGIQITAQDKVYSLVKRMIDFDPF